MKNYPTLMRVGAALLAALILTAMVFFGLLNTPDATVSDAFYQHRTPTDGQIVVVGMDKRAVDILGPMPWPRSVMAQALAYLNADPERRPAAIGVDVLFVGQSADAAADEALIAAAEAGGNVVFASAATFGSSLVTEGDQFYMDERSVLAWDAPFDELLEASATGHINAMPDEDGFIRHAMLYIDVPGVGRTYSFSRVLYEKYAKARHISATV